MGDSILGQIDRRSITILCPAQPGSRRGNRVTALRWQRMLRACDRRVRITSTLPHDTQWLLALHAGHSADAVAELRQRAPRVPIVVALTGTDLYETRYAAKLKQTLPLVDRLVLLQPASRRDLPAAARKKARVIYQSSVPLALARPTHPRTRRVVVAGHLRQVKDPLRTAYAVRKLPPRSNITVHHYGGVLEPSWETKVRREAARNPRYTWHGEVSRGELRRQVARAWLVVMTSKLEGGANFLSESIVQHTPAVVSDIPGARGLLGEDYQGYFPVGDTAALTDQLLRAEDERNYYQQLTRQVKRRAGRFDPARERAAWQRLLGELSGESRTG